MEFIQNGDRIMIKYHNDMNMVSFSTFSQRELNIFFSICSIMNNKGTTTIKITFSELKKITSTFFRSENEFVEYLLNTNEKFLKLNGKFKKNGITTQFILFTTFKTDEINKILEISINQEFVYILNELTKNFTIFELEAFNSLKSSYSKHVFRLLKQFKSTGFFKISILKFRKILGIPENYRMSEINKYVLYYINKELIQYFNNLKIHKVKDGRNITHLEFTFDPQTGEKYDTHTIEPVPTIVKEPPSTYSCPNCNQPLEPCTTKSGVIFYGHKNYATSPCKATYSSVEEIEQAVTEKQQEIKLLEIQQKQEHTLKTIKTLCKEHETLFEYKSMYEKNKCIIHNKIKDEMVIRTINQKTISDMNHIIEIAKKAKEDMLNAMK